MGFSFIPKKYNDNPWDWAQHFVGCFVITFFLGPNAGIVFGVTIEAVQIDCLGWLGWDHFADLGADALGVVAGFYLRKLCEGY